MAVVVVESPAKAKTINKYLGSGYTVLASYGHVRDLPAKDGSVDPDQDFAMKWEVAPDSAKHIRAIAEALKDDHRLILATDPDREGEAISWHLLEALTGVSFFTALRPVRAWRRCQEIASPSRSGSVARMSLSSSLSASAMARTCFWLSGATSHFMAKSWSGSTEPSLAGRSRTCP